MSKRMEASSMATTVALSPQEIKQLGQPRSNSNQLHESARRLEQLARFVESHWHEIDDETKQLLKFVVYSFLEPPSGFRLWLSRLHGSWTLFTVNLRGEQDALAAYYSAFMYLIRAVLAAVEHENADYQAELEQALQVEDEGHVFESADEFEKWLHDVSDKALKEV
jgi:hypothetical protein